MPCTVGRCPIGMGLRGAKGAILSRERMAPLHPKRTQGALPLDPAIARFVLEELRSLRNRVPAIFCI